MYKAALLLDSISPAGARLSTFELRYPRFMHSEFLTHRMLSRNSASNRAIPTKKLVEAVMDEPAMPVSWGANQPGMQAIERTDEAYIREAKYRWLNARTSACQYAQYLADWGLHKQIANRVLEPFQWMTTIATATSWDNFYTLRRHKDAQPEFKHLADMMWEAQRTSVPRELKPREWHIPFLGPLEDVTFSLEGQLKLSVARCARVSYLNHDGKRDPEEDFKLAERLLESKHMSPFEHQAQVLTNFDGGRCANFFGWRSYRYYIENAQSPI